MRARIVELDGTPDEVAQVLAQVQGSNGTLEPTVDLDEGGGDSSAIPSEVQEWFRAWKVKQPQRRYIEQAVEKVQGWGDVEVNILHGRKGERFSGRLRFVRSDQREAFGILGHRGRLFLRLPADFDISGYSHAKRRDTTTKRHGILMYVRSQDAVAEAVELLEKAYELQDQS